MEWIDFCKSHIDELASIYYQRMGVPLNLEHPTTFTEKMQWLKIYDSTYMKTYCSDKFTLHKYCEQVLHTNLCIPILTWFDRVDKFTTTGLPDGFVIKCNHGSGYNIIHKPHTSFNQTDAVKKLTRWMAQDFSLRNGCELHYKMIPRKIIVEPYMNDGHDDLVDYKFYCFNGMPLFCQVITDRHTHERISHYTDGWIYAPQYDWVEFESINNLPMPEFYTDMIDISKKLSKPFKLVRVDFYVIHHQLYLGELTFTPNSGFHHFKDPKTNLVLGEQLKL